MDDYSYNELEQVACPMCGNIECRLLGMLGNLVHLRCKACGWVFAAEEVSA